MGKRKATYPIEDAVLKALKIRAVREGKPDYQVVDEALRRHLYGTWSDLWERAAASRERDLSDEDVMALALDELDAYRRGAPPSPGPA